MNLSTVIHAAMVRKEYFLFPKREGVSHNDEIIVV